MPCQAGLTLCARKGAERILVKTQEYIAERGLETDREKILAPLLVIDVLRCTFEVETPAEDLALGQALARLPVVRTKNGHNAQAQTIGGYADRKFSVRFDSGGPEPVTVVTEVQVLQKSYLALKKKMHAVYATYRGDHDHQKWR